MGPMYGDVQSTGMVHPLKGGFSTEHGVCILVAGALGFLWLVGHGFRGVNAFGASVKVG
jgi:hypothetical protein